MSKINELKQVIRNHEDAIKAKDADEMRNFPPQRGTVETDILFSIDDGGTLNVCPCGLNPGDVKSLIKWLDYWYGDQDKQYKATTA